MLLQYPAQLSRIYEFHSVLARNTKRLEITSILSLLCLQHWRNPRSVIVLQQAHAMLGDSDFPAALYHSGRNASKPHSLHRLAYSVAALQSGEVTT